MLSFLLFCSQRAKGFFFENPLRELVTSFILINSHNFLESSSLAHPSLPQDSVLIQQVRSLFSALSPNEGENWLLWRKHSSMPILIYNVHLCLVTLGCGSCDTTLIFLEKFFFPDDFKVLFLKPILDEFVLCGFMWYFLLCGPVNHFDWREKGKRWKKYSELKMNASIYKNGLILKWNYSRK